MGMTDVPIPDSPPGLITGANAWQFGVLGVIVIAFSWVIVYLFKRYEKRNDQIAVERAAIEKERESWQTEREAAHAAATLASEKLRLEFEVKHRELADRYGKDLVEQIKACRENDTVVRREFTDTLETMAENQQRASVAQVAMIDKLTDRIVIAPKSGRY